MQSSVKQIVVAFEQEKLTIEQICEDQALEPAVVKAALMHGSSEYRKLCNVEKEDDAAKLNFTDDQLRQVNERIFQLAIGSEDENVATKNLHYIRDDKKGRKEVVKQVQNNQFNILNWNEQIRSAREGALEAKRRVMGQLVEV